MYIKRVEEKNMTHMLYIYNTGLKKNIKDKCIPLDYFIERMFQIGLCVNIHHVKDIL